MKFFSCVLRTDNGPVGPAELSRYAPTVDASGACPYPQRLVAGCFGALAYSDSAVLGPRLATSGLLVGAGDVRLDNRNEVLRWTGCDASATDMELVLAAIDRRGVGCISELLGDFAFVAWHQGSHELFAARDAFGVRTLYYTDRPNLLALSSRASLLGSGGYSLDFMADYLVAGSSASEPNPYAGVTTITSGTLLSVASKRKSTACLWSPEQVEIDDSLDAQEQISAFRTAFAAAVQTRLTGRGDAWAQLSGGLDSSSIVSIAHWLVARGDAPAGLAGTVTWVDSINACDEREYAEAVVEQCALRNVQVADYWMWRDDGQYPPLTEIPYPNYPFFARDRYACNIIRNAGGAVLLTGAGSDQYLSSPPYYIADWLVRGRLRAACRATTRWAVNSRTSFWEIGFKYGIVPLLPTRLQLLCTPTVLTVPEWIAPRLVRDFALDERNQTTFLLSAPWGSKYKGATAYDTAHFGRFSMVTPYEEAFDVRHPFLYRPLVELSLRLAPELRTQPGAQKWVLREAMRGILPEFVRQRRHKTGVDDRIVWSFTREKGRIDELVRAPLLSDLGCIDAKRLQTAWADACSGRTRHIASLVCALALETWLRVREGRWVVREHSTSQAASSG